VDQYRKVLVTSFDISEALLHQVVIRDGQIKNNYFKYSAGEQDYFVSYWTVFMKSGFDSPNVNVVLRRSQADVLSPLADFKKIFPLVVLLSFWIVAFLSVYHIRKSLVPLEKLKAGTLKIANNDFKSRVSFKSGDEFEDLADSFNFMSHNLDRHFDALTTRSEIDRAILSSLNLKEIISTALKKMYVFFSCDSISINLAIEKKPLTYHSYISTNIRVRKIEEQFFNITPDEEQFLSGNQKYQKIDLEKTQPGYIAPLAAENMKSALILPLILNQMLKGMIVLGYKDDRVFSSEDLAQARQISDQVTVALSNAALVEQLEKLNLGTLEALARTVDAKSAWTAGHSERVTDLAVRIARIMGLTEKQIETLRRGAYLHDIGKIGIPLAIIDKPDRLTEAEFEMIKEHPVIGARILEPIEAYADVLPMISQHHEKFDGTGYPRGLAGQDITLGARIMAVADVYDAVVSDRPYRHGWIEEKAIDLITSESGTHFDPEVVDAFLVAVSS
ncbi:MAG: HD domain-containing protein, partial [Proteobacteria bacterium]|nr:HD domain-containing protein [Pseudomonadota bacterium]